jgi:hypothetical protein
LKLNNHFFGSGLSPSNGHASSAVSWPLSGNSVQTILNPDTSFPQPKRIHSPPFPRIVPPLFADATPVGP